MDKKAAIQLIENTFNARFDEDQFALFIKNLLNDTEPKSNTYSGNLIWDDHKEHINSYKRIGKYVDPEGDAMDILIVEVKSVSKLERARTALRNFVIKHLSKFDKDFALVAFYSKEDQGSDWRFSFIKLEHKSYKDEVKGKVKTRKEFTPAKRYSFLVGKYEKTHTAKNQLLPLLQNIANNPTLEQLEKAFSIETVTDEFFGQYKDLYVKLFEHFQKDKHVKRELEKANIDNARFTKKLLGQIVFLYFLQKKGWLGVPENQPWGKGEKRFVQKLYEQAENNQENFFRDYLQYLFYQALAKERNNENSYYDKFNCRIPFLNGGLFEAEYEWEKANISIPNTLFRSGEENEDKRTGVLDVFDRYNFTIKEDEPLDKEVAVDPEMLGKVFENMLEITERKSKGAFYTPREIVHYMCQESLIHYLDNALPEVDKKDLEVYIREGHFALENDQRVAEKGETKTYRFQLPESVRNNADKIDEKLMGIRICDPAIGSGAFPVGLLHELVAAHLIIKPHLSYNYFNKKLDKFNFKEKESVNDSRYIYRLKRHIIQESIYGVDIDASAIDIARLRLWLSLVVDEDDLDPIETLPNLDYKIVRGNSLMSRYNLDDSIDKVFSDFNKKVNSSNYNNESIKKLIGNSTVDLEFYQKLTNEFLIESSHEKKELFRVLISEIKNSFKAYFDNKKNDTLNNKKYQLNLLTGNDLFGAEKSKEEKKRISELKKEITTIEKKKSEVEEGLAFKDALEWRFEFPNLLDKDGNFIGFDIVIGNPPYIQISKLDKIIKTSLSQMNFDTFSSSGDIYELFYEKGNELLASNGHLCYITSNKWLRANYGTSTRNFFLTKTNPKILFDFGQEMVFSTAIVHSNILLFQKGGGNNEFKGCQFANSKLEALDQYFEFNSINLDYLNEEVWAISTPELIEIKSRLEQIGKKLALWNLGFFRGILTGFNEAFLIDSEKKAELVQSDPKSEKILKPILRGRDTRKYYCNYHDLYLINTHNGDKKNNIKRIDVPKEFPVIYEYLSTFQPKINKRADKGDHWTNLRNCAFLEEVEKDKIVFSEIVSEPQFYYDTKKYYPEASAFLITGENLKWLTALLNSELITVLFRVFYAGGELVGKYRYKKSFLENLPIPEPREDFAPTINTLVDILSFYKGIFQDKSKDQVLSTYFESIVDGLVYELIFETEIKSAKKEILKHLSDLKPISDEMTDEEKLAIIQSEFERLYKDNNPVKIALETLDSIEEVRIIKEALK